MELQPDLARYGCPEYPSAHSAHSQSHLLLRRLRYWRGDASPRPSLLSRDASTRSASFLYPRAAPHLQRVRLRSGYRPPPPRTAASEPHAGPPRVPARRKGQPRTHARSPRPRGLRPPRGLVALLDVALRRPGGGAARPPRDRAGGDRWNLAGGERGARGGRPPPRKGQ